MPQRLFRTSTCWGLILSQPYHVSSISDDWSLRIEINNVSRRRESEIKKDTAICEHTGIIYRQPIYLEGNVQTIDDVFERYSFSRIWYFELDPFPISYMRKT